MTDRQSVLVLLILLTGILMLVFGDVFLHPNAYLFGTIGDSIKNYFTFAWYVVYDSGLHFSGMNYPFGEHIVYTDNQPLFSVPLGFVHRHVFPLNHCIFGIINSIVFLSMLGSAVVLYFILRKCLLPAWYAIIGAMLIVLLSPQHFFISQQYALTNTLVLPAIWLTVIRLFERPDKFRRCIYYLLVMLAAGFVHPYFLAIGTLLFSGYWLWFAFREKRNIFRNWLKPGYLLFCGIIPVLFFKLFLNFTDNVTDRPENPHYLLEGKANLAGLFYPVNSFSSYLLQTVFQKKVPFEENHGYIGLAGLLFLVLFIAAGIWSFRKPDPKKIADLNLPFPLTGGFVAGLLILFFAMAIPVQLGLHQFVPALKQFRITSRFAWMFYYLFTACSIFLSYRVYLFLLRQGRSITAYGWLIVILSIWVTEAVYLLRAEAKLLHPHKLAAAFSGREENVEQILKQANRRATDFQMIIPIPYYSDGSEKIGYHNWQGTMYQSMKTAFQTGIPISTASLARTSLRQVLLRTQLLSSDSLQKELLPLLPSRKPILVVVTDSAEKDYEKRLLQKSRFLARQGNVSYYELPLAALEKIYHAPADSHPLNPNKLPDNVVYQTFAGSASEKWLFREGAFSAKTGPATLFNGSLPNASARLSYEFSVWVNATAAIGIPVIKLEEYNAENEVVSQQLVNLKGATEIYRDWLKATVYFKLKTNKNRIKITAEGKNIVADELLIRPVKPDLYFYAEDQKQLIRNNYPVYPELKQQ